MLVWPQKKALVLKSRDPERLINTIPAAKSFTVKGVPYIAVPHRMEETRVLRAMGYKACTDSMRLAIAPAGQINDPMLVRVPAASLKTLGSYGSQLAKRGVEPQHVITKIGFDYSVAHPALTFKAVRFVEENELAEIEQVLVDEAETIGNITGVTGSTTSENENKAEAAPVAKRSEKLAAAEEQAKVMKKTEVKTEASDEAPEAEEKVSSVADYNDIHEALNNLDFDD